MTTSSIAAPSAQSNSAPSPRPVLRADTWKLARSQPLEPSEVDADFRRYKAEGDSAAAQRLVQSHMRLVASIAYRYCGPKVALDDLMAEGALALYRALDNFDPSRGASFTGYASVVIGFAVKGLAAEHSCAMRIPSRERGRSAVRGRAASAYYAAHGSWPTAAELAAFDVEGTLPVGRSSRPAAVVADFASLDVESGSGGPRASSVADMGPTPLEAAAGMDDARRVAAAIETLPPRLAKVVRMRFGIGEEPHGLARLASSLRLTQAAVELLLLEGLRSLRQSLAGAA